MRFKAEILVVASVAGEVVMWGMVERASGWVAGRLGDGEESCSEVVVGEAMLMGGLMGRRGPGVSVR